MSQRLQAVCRDDSGLPTLCLFDARGRAHTERRALSDMRSSASDASMLRSRVSSSSRVFFSAPAELQVPAPAELVDDAEPTLGMSLLGGVVPQSGARDILPAANTYNQMSITLPIVWFFVGLAGMIPGPSFQKYLVNVVNVPPAQQVVLGVIGSMVFQLKIIAAFLSDVVPICGCRRKPYLIFGLLVQVVAWCCLGFFGETLSFALLCLQQFGAFLGQMLVSVMIDTLVVENMRHEIDSGGTIGRLQTNCWLWNTIGGFVGSLVSGWLPQYANVPILWMFIINGCLKALLLVIVVFVRDPKFGRSNPLCESVRVTWSGIWGTMTLVRVLRPIVFLIAFSVTPGAGHAFNSYIIQKSPLCAWSADDACVSNVGDTAGYNQYCAPFSDRASCITTWGGLGFSESQFAYMGIIGSVGAVIGNFAFKMCFINTGWHKLMASVIIIVIIVNSLQLLLMFRNDAGVTVNEQAGIPDFAFALGDDAVENAANQLLNMPILILMALLCPVGAEGTVYALVTSIQGSAGTIKGILSKMAIEWFGVTNTDFSRLWQLTLCVQLTKVTALFFLPLVPEKLDHGQGDRRHWLPGVFLLCFFFGGLLWALIDVILSVF